MSRRPAWHGTSPAHVISPEEIDMYTLAEADRQFALHPFTHLANHEAQGPFII